MFDSYWIQEQIENHPIWGPLSKGGNKVLFVYLGIVVVIFTTFQFFSNTEPSNAQIAKYLILLALLYWGFKNPDKSIIQIYWVSLKITLLIACFITFLVGGVIGYLRNQPEAIYCILLAIIWIPGIELFSYFARKQKLIFIIKAILSSPIIAHMILITK